MRANNSNPVIHPGPESKIGEHPTLLVPLNGNVYIPTKTKLKLNYSHC